MSKKPEGDPFEKLVKLTKLIKDEKVKVEPKGFLRSKNKWRTEDPKFGAKPEKKSDNLVQAGGMEVDASLKDEYEAWRRDKEQEARDRRDMAERRQRAADEARRESEKGPETGA